MNTPKIIEDIYNVFKEYYGEDKTDLQTVESNYNILVHWPEVTVANEYNESIVIWHLYSKIIINPSGKLLSQPAFNRTEYNEMQWYSDYAHSHLPGINKVDIRSWRTSCLGEGPINNTIAKLRASTWTEYVYGDGDNIEHNYSGTTMYTDMQVWQLFCWELDKYVHIESVEGGPYRRLKNVGLQNNKNSTVHSLRIITVPPSNQAYVVLIKKFVKHLLSLNLLEFSYSNGNYTIGWSFTDTVLNISNCFIEWFNLANNNSLRKDYDMRAMLRNEFLKKAFISTDSLIYEVERTHYGSNNNLHSNIGEELFIFKGKPVHFTINTCNLLSTTPYLILHPEVISFILYKILRFLNTYYGKEIQIRKAVLPKSIVGELYTTDNNSDTSATGETKDRYGEKARVL